MNLVLLLSALLAALTGAIGSARLPEPRRLEVVAGQVASAAETLPVVLAPRVAHPMGTFFRPTVPVAPAVFDLASRRDHRGERRRE